MTTDVLALLNPGRLELGPVDIVSGSPWRHWRLARDEDDTAWLVLDRRDSSVNTLDEAVLEELAEITAELRRRPPRALVLRSAKPAGFCVGADVGMFREAESADSVVHQLQRAHEVVDGFEDIAIPRIAVLHGACLGGGLELALACDYRIAIEGAMLGFPEVQLGLHPGLGGTFRSSRQINPLQAMKLMLTGKPVPAERARKLGLVDAVTCERHVRTAVSAAGEGALARASRPRYCGLLEQRWSRDLAARRMMAQTRQRVSRDHYPAPFQLIELWRRHGGNRAAMQVAETESFARLVTSPAGQNLVRVFFLREALKRQASGEQAAVEHVHVVGAGAMGGDIAAWCALRGLRVTLADTRAEVIADAVRRAAELCRSKHRGNAATREVLDRLIPDPAGDGVRHADLLIEAVPEKTEIKRAVYAQLQKQMKPAAILATNTSSIPLETLREDIERPENFVGLHFFNPVSRMQLVEVVAHDRASAASLARARAFTAAIDRLPVPVQSAPGFLVNRVLTPYLLEAMCMLDEGMAPETLDQAALDFGMPMGPAEMADQVGLDICVDVADMLRQQLADEPLLEVPAWLRDKVESGATGRKAGRGLYRWSDSGPEKKGGAARAPADTADRLLLPLLNACVTCLRQQVVADADILDAAVIFGTGFAPFRGGPLHYAQQRGVDVIEQRLRQLAGRHGRRFEPDPGWQQLVD